MSIITDENFKLNNLHKIDKRQKENLASIVAKNIAETFNEYNISYEYIYNKIMSVDIVFAEFKENIAGKYMLGKNKIYINSKAIGDDYDFKSIKDIDASLIHEIIHAVQERNSGKYKKQLGLFKMDEENDKESYGLGLNEAAVQYVTSNICGSSYLHVRYFNLDFFTISENIYPIETSLVMQMAFFTGTYPLISSTILSNDLFENTYTLQTSKKTYMKIANNIDDIIYMQDVLSDKYTSLAKTKMNEKSKLKILDYIKENKKLLKEKILETQKIIYESSFKSLFKKINAISDIQELKDKITKFEDLIILDSEDLETFDYADFKEKAFKKLDKAENKIKMFGSNYLKKNITNTISTLPAIRKTNPLKIVLDKIKLLFTHRTKYSTFFSEY